MQTPFDKGSNVQFMLEVLKHDPTNAFALQAIEQIRSENPDLEITQQFICRIVIEDDVNSTNILNLHFLLDAADSDVCLEVLKTRIRAEIVRLGITETSNPSTNTIIVEAYCQLLSDGEMNTTRWEGHQPASYRSWEEHL